MAEAEVVDCGENPVCDTVAPPEIELDDPSISVNPVTEAEPVIAGPPVVTGSLTRCDISYLQFNFKPLINFTDVAAAAATAARYEKESQAAPSEIEQRDREGFIESDEVASNSSEHITKGDFNPLLVSFKIMEDIESQIKTHLLGHFFSVFNTLYDGLLGCVPDLGANTIKGFVGITRCGFLSKYTTVIYYAGKIPYSHREAIVTLIEQCNTQINPIIQGWSSELVKYKCKVEKSQVQYDTQKIILCIKLPTDNVIQIPILNVVGFPVFQDVTPLLTLVTDPSLPCFFTPQFNGVATAFMTAHPTQFTKFIASNPQAQGVADAFMTAYPAEFAQFASNPQIRAELQTLSLLDIIVRVRICANQGAITALSEPSKEEVMLILSCFQGLIPHGILPPSDVTAIAAHINTITSAMRPILYLDPNPRIDPNANIKPFALFCNIFYNFINVSLGFKSLAKIIYSDFFGASDNYGKVIRACKVVNRLPIMSDRVKFFLTGSNAARVYLALNDIIKLGVAALTPENIQSILNGTFGKLSDNDFMIYLKNDDSEPYRVFIRMILGGSFYFFKNLFDDTTTRQFTLEMIQSVGIVGYMDHLFAQRFDASAVFLQQCYGKDPTSFLAHILPTMGTWFPYLDKQINVAQFDGVFKYYTLKKFYQEVFRIFGLIGKLSVRQAGLVYTFLIDHATSIDCIATVWTLVLNVLYTLFVPENCLARIAVGKFDNDPKNLKLYMEILNDHLYEVGRNSTENEESDFIKDINELLGYQKSIIDSCNGGINRGLDEERLNLFKQTCGQWVLKMVSMVVRVSDTGASKYKGLFMLSEADAGSVGNRSPTTLERALCLAYLPTLQGNICSAASSPSGQVIFRNEILKIMTTRYSLDKTLKFIDPNEIALNARLHSMGELMFNYFTSSNDSRIVPTPPIPDQHIGTQLPLSTYLNFMWQHLTKTAIKLKNLFKENLQDTKRVTGIKYIALVLGGYFQIRLLVKDTGTDGNISQDFLSEIIYCKRGLLPLLPQNPFIDLISNIIEIDIGNELSHAAAAATTIHYLTRGITTQQYAAAGAVGITPEHFVANIIGITTQQYAAAGAAAAAASDAAAAVAMLGITPEQYAAAAIYATAYNRANVAYRSSIVDIKMNRGSAVYICFHAAATTVGGLGEQAADSVYAAMYAAAINAAKADPMPRILKILGFLFSIKVKSSSPHSPYQLLRLEDSMLSFKQDYDALYPQVFEQAGTLNPQVCLNGNPEAYSQAYQQFYQKNLDPAFQQAYQQTYQHAYQQAYQQAYRQAYEQTYHQVYQPDAEYNDAAVAAAAAPAASRAAHILAFDAAVALSRRNPDEDLHAAANLHAAAHVTTLETLSKGRKILNPTIGIFIEFITTLLRSLGIPDNSLLFKQIMKCICRAKPDVAQIDSAMLAELTASNSMALYEAMGGSNDSESNSGRNSVSSLNKYKHKYKHNKLARNNRTHRNKNKRKKNSKSKSHKPKSKSKSKSKSGKSRRKNVTFKRRKRSNKH